MSKLHLESRDSRKAYFEQTEYFHHTFNRFYLDDNKIMCLDESKLEKNDLGKGGVPLSTSDSGEYIYIDQTDSHTLVIGPTGSKKSRLVAMPTVNILGVAGESMIISDPKAEIYARTANALLEKGYKVVVLNLRSPNNGGCWNPLAIPYRYYCDGSLDKSYEFVNDIAENLTKTEASVKDPFWDNSAGSLFFALSILLFKYCKDFGYNSDAVHIGNVMRLRSIMLSGNSVSVKNHPLWRYAKRDSFILSSLIGTVEAPNETRASILSVFDQKMRMFSLQPNLVAMLAENTISFDKLDEEPTAIYLILPDEKTSYHHLVSLFIKQSYEYLIDKAQIHTEGKGFSFGRMYLRVNYILDEFSSLPTIKDFPAMVTAARSRNIRFSLFIQSKHQLLLRYAEEAETIQSNCNNWIFLTSRELQFLQELSLLCGNTKDNTKPILSISELQRLDKQSGESLLLCGRLRPHIAKLTDIDKYDKRKRHQLQVPPLIGRNAYHELDFDIDKEKLLEKVMGTEVGDELEKLGIPASHDSSVDEIISKIDKKIAELEAEEKRNSSVNKQDK